MIHINQTAGPGRSSAQDTGLYEAYSPKCVEEEFSEIQRNKQDRNR